MKANGGPLLFSFKIESTDVLTTYPNNKMPVKVAIK